MKFSKLSYYQFWGGFFLLLGLFACKPEQVSPAELVVISEPRGEFLLYSPDNSRYAFEITTNNLEGNKIQYVRVMLSLENGSSYELTKVQNFPARIDMTLTEAVESISSIRLADLKRENFIKVLFLAKKENAGEEVLPTQLELQVSCPAPGIEGIYESESYGVSGPGGGGKFSGIKSRVEIKALDSYSFEISDATGGVFAEIWAAKPEPAFLFENCRELEFPDFTDQFDDTFSGKALLTAEGDIELRWESSYGDQGVTFFRKK